MHISSSHAKMLGETNFHTREIPQSGSKAKDGEKDILNDGGNKSYEWRTHGAWANKKSWLGREEVNEFCKIP